MYNVALLRVLPKLGKSYLFNNKLVMNMQICISAVPLRCHY